MYGLQPLKRKTFLELVKGKTDYSHHKTFGSAPLAGLPDKYLLVSPILNQGQLFQCTAYSACATQSSQHGIEFDTQWFFDQEGQVAGKTNPFGYDLRVEMSTGCKAGFKPLLGGNPTDYVEGSYFAVDGPYDLFDNIRSAMWQSQNEKKCVIAGTMWYSDWNFQSVVRPGQYPTGLHAIKIAGWETINDIPYLVVQNSFGRDYGDLGLYYFSREMTNKYLKEGTYLWRTKQEVAQTQSAILTLMYQILQLISGLFKKPEAQPVLTPQPVPQAVSLPTIPSNIETWAKTIEQQEGGKPGNRNTRNNNPGNIKYTPFTKTLGAISGDSGNFCIFPNYKTGFDALCTFLIMACKNQLKDYHDATIDSFTTTYANPPNKNYALAVAKALKVGIDTKISTLI